ncbi:hypothetical protein, partial [Caballeronia sp. ATUFL_F2_KS9A]|uniref:hypothetical protein n=1 Tax=Caballeronia sp. ATUFL_F2_KS9A TaxID=2921777 RepID=UPI0020283D22
TVKRLHADDSADTRVKVGNRQAPHAPNKNPTPKGGVFAFEARYLRIREVRVAQALESLYSFSKSTAAPSISPCYV